MIFAARWIFGKKALAALAAAVLGFGLCGTTHSEPLRSRIVTGEIRLPPAAARINPSDILVWSGRGEYEPAVQSGDGKILFAVVAPEDGACVVSTLVRTAENGGEEEHVPFLSGVVLPGEDSLDLDTRSTAVEMAWTLTGGRDDESDGTRPELRRKNADREYDLLRKLRASEAVGRCGAYLAERELSDWKNMKDMTEGNDDLIRLLLEAAGDGGN
jgi:hypothetical protein